MNIPNNTAQVAANFRDFTSAEIKHEKAIGKIVQRLKNEGVKEADIKKGGRYISAFMEGVALAVLTDAQFNVWADENITTRVKGELTARGKLKANVSSRADKIRKAYIKALAEPAAPAEKRGKKERKTFDQVVHAKVSEWIERIEKNKDKDSFNLEADPHDLRLALMAVKEIVKG